MLTQASSQSWILSNAAHLLNRAGFGGTPAEIEAFHAMGRKAAIEHLLGKAATPSPIVKVPEFENGGTLFLAKLEIRKQQNDLTPEQRREKIKEIQQKQAAVLREMRTWWIQRMTDPAYAPLEKATLFWHGHFATSVGKVRDPSLMWQQNTTLRTHAFGNFANLLKAMSRDPAMMIWLDLQNSHKQAPNENWARELMELFSLGIGNYTETDIKNSARAFTGYRFNRQAAGFRFLPQEHDETEKTFMGRKGNFGGDDIIDIILDQPACAEFIAGKLWTFYAYEDPESDLIKTLARVLRRSKYELRPFFAAMYGSQQFYSDKAVRTQIKSPTQLVVATCHSLECKPPRGHILQQVMAGLGQTLFAPPNVKGWDSNRAWINTATITLRNRLTDTLLLANRNPDAAKRLADRGAASRVSIDAIVPKHIQTDPEQLIDALTFRIFQTRLPPTIRKEFLDYWNAPRADGKERTIRDLIAHMMRTPLFQLC
ncbi:MAG TPA: DUF1800 domain-containing protein [Chthoniobacterales bacterium]